MECMDERDGRVELKAQNSKRGDTGAELRCGSAWTSRTREKRGKKEITMQHHCIKSGAGFLPALPMQAAAG